VGSCEKKQLLGGRITFERIKKGNSTWKLVPFLQWRHLAGQLFYCRHPRVHGPADILETNSATQYHTGSDQLIPHVCSHELLMKVTRKIFVKIGLISEQSHVPSV